MVRVTGIEAKIIPITTEEASVGTTHPGRIRITKVLQRLKAVARVARVPNNATDLAIIGPPTTIPSPMRVNDSEAVLADHPLSSSNRLLIKAKTSRYMKPNVVYMAVTGFQPGTRRSASNPPMLPLSDSCSCA
tara:strand:- start:473 stop:871 length:399 start_codon:yes stop_codon:yes gene_type:complete